MATSYQSAKKAALPAYSHFKSVVCASLIALSLSHCTPQMRIAPGEIPAPVHPAQDERQAAEGYVQGHLEEEGFTKITNGKDLKRLKTILNKLEVAAGYSPNSFPLHYVDAGEEANAMVFNGASIVVYKKFVERVANDDQLAVILAHEMGHLLSEHSDEDNDGAQTAVSVGSTIFGTLAAVAMSAAGYHGGADLVGSLTETTSEVIGTGLVLRFDRRQEYEADHIGLLLMAKAGYDPREALVFWENAEEIFDTSSTQAGAFLSTHPSFQDRKDALEEALVHALPIYEQQK